PGNLLLVIDSGLNMEKVLSIVESIDQPSMREGPEIVYLKHSSADAVAKIINEGTIRRSRAVPQPATGEDSKAVADQRLNAVVIFGDKGARESIKSLIALLDVPSPEAQGRINVYFLEHADASELVKVIEGIIRGGQPRQQAAAAPGAPSVTPFEAAGGITVTADKSSNALVIVASPSDYQNLLQVIRQLDRQRRQVFVEAMIVEASMDKLRELGIKWRATVQKDGEPVVIGGFGTIDSAAIQTILTGLQGATLGGLGNFLDVPFTTVRPDGSVVKSTLTIPGFAALFNLNEFKGSINVLSSPQILTSDNKEAEIVVGENVPFITKRESDPTRTASVFSTIERKDVGIILKITPQVTEGDHVKLNIYQEISALKNESEVVTITVGPSITKRATTTSVVVKDRQTVIIGGLMQERIEDNITKLPFLGDLPLLGYLFRNRSTSREKTNLLVFLTPNIVKQAENLDAITETKRKEFAVAEGRYTPGEVLVKFKEGVTRERAVEIIGERGSVILGFIQAAGIYHLKLREKLPVEEGVKEFGLYPEVKYAEPNYTIKMQ
ncbi:MAG TPA: type II secretion system secretin GspD, partial [Dissulfurispiraceae bacterium]|nr:type II secretion system secretin GspD [Dissulfurispiraceae bacterium]